jgi:hypothetical protein
MEDGGRMEGGWRMSLDGLLLAPFKREDNVLGIRQPRRGRKKRIPAWMNKFQQKLLIVGAGKEKERKEELRRK